VTKSCFLCGKKLGFFADTFGKYTLSQEGHSIPKGFGDEDVICLDCLQPQQKLEKPKLAVDQTCFLCNGKVATIGAGKISSENILVMGLQPPEGMSGDDRICRKCYRQKYVEEEKVIQEKAKQIAIEEKRLKEEIKERKKEEIQDLINRAQIYKKDWNKDGIIQFKNERIAILKRAWGSQVEFIVAFDDVTKEGYRLMLVDEGKEASAGGFTGGVNAYFYFQKMEFVR